MGRNPKIMAGAVLGTVLVFLLIFYALIQSREYLEGPSIEIFEPLNGSTATTSFTDVSGIAKNVAFISLNGRQIYTDERGRFKEPLIMYEGYNIITIDAKDRFGREIRESLELVYKPAQNQNANSKMENSSSTAP